MEAKQSITLNWCEKHKNWWVTNCPDCMLDANEEDIKQDGRKEVIGELQAILDNNLPLESSIQALIDKYKTQ